MTQISKCCFTSFQEKSPNFDEKTMKYMIYQREKCPNTNKLHWQGYLILTRSQRIKKIQELIGDEKAHIEKSHGTDEDCIKYCSKQESFHSERKEFGTKPEYKPGKRSDLTEFTNYIKNNNNKKIMMTEILEKFPNIQAKYPKYVNTVIKNYKKRLIETEETRDEMTTIHIITGETGSGKTTWIKKNCTEGYWKNEDDHWWDGYNGQEVIIINEWTNEGKINIMEIFKLSDHAPYKVQTKGGFTQILAKEIWITTNISKYDILQKIKPRHKKALERRTTWYKMDNFECRHFDDESKDGE